MTASFHPHLETYLEAVLPISHVLEQARNFLTECQWRLEIDDQLVIIPTDTELYVRSRAWVKADVADVFLGDHFEAVVLIGAEIIGRNICATYGVLRIYFDQEGHFVSEDRYNRYQ